MTSGGRMMVEQWATRRWTSTVSGAIHINVTVFKIDGTPERSGILAHVLVDGVMIWSQKIAPDDYKGVKQTLSATVNVGSTVDLALDPFEGNDLNDETYFAATITR